MSKPLLKEIKSYIIYNMIKSDIISILDKYPIIALAVSGGSDSMAMSEWFVRNRPKNSFMIVNIDHHIRGEESSEDSNFVARYSIDNNIKYLHYDIDAVAYATEQGMTLEQAARVLRHDIFRTVCHEHAYVVATAHHESDQVESVLMHIARGSGISGLSGMSVEDGHLIRPLINTSKEQVKDYISEHNISYREDSTNVDTAYTRNYMRGELIPTFEKKYPMLKTSILKLAKRANQQMDYVDSMTPALEVVGNSVTCDIKGQHVVIASEMIRRAFSLLGVESDIEERHVDLLIALAGKENGTKLDMPHNKVAYNEYGSIVLTMYREVDQINIPFAEGVFELDDGELIIEKVAKRVADDNALYMTADSIEDDIVIRYRQDKDTINKFGGGSKSLGDFMTDKKVPVRLRDTTPVIACGSDILCLVGVDISRTVAVSDTSKSIYKISKNEF